MKNLFLRLKFLYSSDTYLLEVFVGLIVLDIAIFPMNLNYEFSMFFGLAANTLRILFAAVGSIIILANIFCEIKTTLAYKITLLIFSFAWVTQTAALVVDTTSLNNNADKILICLVMTAVGILLQLKLLKRRVV